MLKHLQKCFANVLRHFCKRYSVKCKRFILHLSTVLHRW